jgi:hypothetical protein
VTGGPLARTIFDTVMDALLTREAPSGEAAAGGTQVLRYISPRGEVLHNPMPYDPEQWQLELSGLCVAEDRIGTPQGNDRICPRYDGRGDPAVDTFCTSVRGALNAPSFEVQQKVLQLVVDRIVVEDSRVIIEHVMPTGPVRLHTEHLLPAPLARLLSGSWNPFTS